MQFMSIALPPPAQGVDFSKEEILVVPDQSLSLEDILRRFTTGEPLDVKHDESYVDDLSEGDDYSDTALSDVDLEKIKYADLVDKEDFSKRLQTTRDEYDRQLAAQEKAAKEAELARIKADEEERIQKAAAKLAGKREKEG